MLKVFKPYLIAIAMLIVLALTYEFMRRKVGGFAGSYPFAESWTVNTTIDSVERAISALKLKEPRLFPPNDTLKFEKDFTGYWRKINFLYEDQIFCALIREKDKQTSLLIYKTIDTNTGDVRLINRDYDFIQHRKLINRFKTNLLNPIIAELEIMRVQLPERNKKPALKIERVISYSKNN